MPPQGSFFSRRIYEFVMGSEVPVSVYEVADAVGCSVEHVRRRVLRMCEAEVLRREKAPGNTGRGGNWHWEYSPGPAEPTAEMLRVRKHPSRNRLQTRDEGVRLQGIITQFMRDPGGLIGLAGAVLTMAILDWRCEADAARTVAGSMGFESVAEDVRQFWGSEDGVLMREVLGIPGFTIEDIALKWQEQGRFRRVR